MQRRHNNLVIFQNDEINMTIWLHTTKHEVSGVFTTNKTTWLTP